MNVIKFKIKPKILLTSFIASCALNFVSDTIAQAAISPIHAAEHHQEVMTPAKLAEIIAPIVDSPFELIHSYVEALRLYVGHANYQIGEPGRFAAPHELFFAYQQAALYHRLTGDGTLIDTVHDYINTNLAHVTQETAIELLIRSASYGGYCSNFLRFLIDNFHLSGSVINTRSETLPNSFTPLEAAINGINPTAVEILLNAGAQTDQANTRGETPYQLAVRYIRITEAPRQHIQAFREIISIFHRHGITQ